MDLAYSATKLIWQFGDEAELKARDFARIALAEGKPEVGRKWMQIALLCGIEKLRREKK